MHFSRLINEFISEEEQAKLMNWFCEVRDRHGENKAVVQENLKSLQDSINGWANMKIFSDAEELRQLAHSLVEGDDKDFGEIPDFVMDIRQRIIDEWKIPGMEEKSFMQFVMVGPGGHVHSHYDPAPDGYVTCRCNLFFSTWDGDSIYIDKKHFPIKERDLICFAASLYKHKTEPCQCENRVFCSFGFLIPYESLGIDFDDPRARLAQRIWKSFIDLKGSNYAY